jgi:hypothetical protein
MITNRKRVAGYWDTLLVGVASVLGSILLTC